MKKNISIFIVLTLALTLVFASSVSAATYVDEAGSGGTPPKPKTGAPVDSGTGAATTGQKNAAQPPVDDDPVLPPVDDPTSDDDDGDGVPDALDLCPGTEDGDHWFTYDTPGWNIWKFSSIGWATRNDTGKQQGPKGSFTLDEMAGCSCTQILDTYYGEDFVGKYSCTPGMLEEVAEDVKDGLLGYELVETVVVPALSSTPTLSTFIPELETSYKLIASGTALAGDNIQFDAQYASVDGVTWTDLVPGYEQEGPGLLNLIVDGVDSGWGAYNAAHTYQIEYIGTGSAIGFHIYDISPENNTGGLSVDIYKPIY